MHSAARAVSGPVGPCSSMRPSDPLLAFWESLMLSHRVLRVASLPSLRPITSCDLVLAVAFVLRVPVALVLSARIAARVLVQAPDRFALAPSLPSLYIPRSFRANAPRPPSPGSCVRFPRRCALVRFGSSRHGLLRVLRRRLIDPHLLPSLCHIYIPRFFVTRNARVRSGPRRCCSCERLSFRRRCVCIRLLPSPLLV